MAAKYEHGKGIVLEGTNEFQDAINNNLAWEEVQSVVVIAKVRNGYQTVVGGVLGVELLGTIDLLKDAILAQMA